MGRKAPSVHLMLADDLLTVIQSDSEVERWLTIEEKFLEQDPNNPRITRSRKRKRAVFRVTKENPRVIVTMQGFWRDLRNHLKGLGYSVTMSDHRTPLPPPRLDLMHGFRFSQRELLERFLTQEYSGLLGAPTRYGKSTALLNTLRAYSGVSSTVVTAPGADLVRQLYEFLHESLPQRKVVLVKGNRLPGEDVDVVSMDSLHKIDNNRTRLLLIDEPHASVTDSRLPLISGFTHARRLGYGATLTGRYDGRDALIKGLIGPVLVERTYKEAVEEGAICPLVVYMLRIPVNASDAKRSWSRNKAYESLLFRSERIGNIVSRLCLELIPPDWQTILFIRNEKQADFYLDKVGRDGTIAMAKKLTASERAEVMEAMRGDKVKRCLASDIYAQGVTFNHVRAMVNIAGGGNNTMTIQKPGRLAEVRPGKKCGVIFDLLFVPGEGLSMDSFGSGTKMLFLDSRNRVKAYEDKGYEVREVVNLAELRKHFLDNCI